MNNFLKYIEIIFGIIIAGAAIWGAKLLIPNISSGAPDDILKLEFPVMILVMGAFVLCEMMNIFKNISPHAKQEEHNEKNHNNSDHGITVKTLLFSLASSFFIYLSAQTWLIHITQPVTK